MNARTFRAVALAGASTLMLSGCLLTPGQFTSELQVMKDGRFAYSYDGEIQMLALGNLAKMGASTDEAFAAECWNDDFEDRPCTEAETAEQREEWEANATSRREKKEREAKAVSAMLGGIAPSNPEAAKELAERLQRQRGWKTVDYKGDGVFEVSFAISGTLTHDFAFPTVEKMAIANHFVSVNLREGGQVRVDAPGFGPQGGANPMQGMMSGIAAAAKEEGDADKDFPQFAVPNGTFSIITDGRILANNTDEGPKAHALGQALSWGINERTEQPPTALIALD